MATLVRAILTGFGLRIGSEIAKAVGEHVRGRVDARKQKAVRASSRAACAEESDADEGLPAGADL
jgi:hypothetical protein